MKIIVKLFGPEAQAVSNDHVAIDLPSDSPTCAEVRQALAIAEPKLEPALSYCRFAINNEYIRDDETMIQPNDEVALIGMVSGG